MTALLTVDELRAHIPDGVAYDDPTLTRVLDGCQAILDRHAGALTITDDDPLTIANVTERVAGRGQRLITLRQVPTAIVSVTSAWGTNQTELEATDYRLDYRTLYATDALGAFGGETIEVVYTPADDRSIRILALVQLCLLELNWKPGIGFQGAGGWQESYSDPNAARDAILATVRPFDWFA